MTDPLTQSLTRLINQVQHWTPARWEKPAASGGGSRADVVHALAQRLADAAAEAAALPKRPVPRLDNDLALTDQLRVLGSDLSAVASPALAEASVADVRGVAAAL